MTGNSSSCSKTAAKKTLESLSGVGPRKAEALRLLGIETIADLLRYYPRRYEDRRRLVRIADLPGLLRGGRDRLEPGREGAVGDGGPVVLRATVENVQAPPFAGRGGRKIPARIRVNDGSGSLSVVFFNLPWINRVFEPGQTYWFFGPVRFGFSGPVMTHPAFEREDEGETEDGGEGRRSREAGANSRSAFLKIVPVYALATGISQKFLRSLTAQALRLAEFPEDPLPAGIVSEQRLAPADFALRAIHYPEDDAALRAARYRLIFEELFLLQAGLLWLRNRQDAQENGIAFSAASGSDEFYALLPFEPTEAQRRSVREIYADMESPRPMHRMLQGDVGSGKTAVAMGACLKAVRNGRQAVVMAPTEILAAQHYAEFSRLFAGTARVDFLASGLTAKGKAAV
ncbi:MAG: DEAD/DEAH box helicase, partial [Clostridiales bacterium]|nr:DEAD/DEAH box helicase [Clostridiales bacterium]